MDFHPAAGLQNYIIIKHYIKQGFRLLITNSLILYKPD